MVSQGAVRRRVTRRGHAAAARARKVFPWRQIFIAIAGIFFRDRKNNHDHGPTRTGHPGQSGRIP